MKSGTRRALRPNAEWPGIIDRVLGRAGGNPAAARIIMWQEVIWHVLHAQLPVGPLSDDDDVRRDIAVNLLARLEAEDDLRLRDWRDQSNVARASWWGWIQSMEYTLGIDAARAHERNIEGDRQSRFTGCR